MSLFVSWIVFPLLLTVLALGCGLLLEEVAGRHTVVGRRLGRKDATAAGAAGATVALLGTAALVRRARKARRRI